MREKHNKEKRIYEDREISWCAGDQGDWMSWERTRGYTGQESEGWAEREREMARLSEQWAGHRSGGMPEQTWGGVAH